MRYEYVTETLRQNENVCRSNEVEKGENFVLFLENKKTLKPNKNNFHSFPWEFNQNEEEMKIQIIKRCHFHFIELRFGETDTHTETHISINSLVFCNKKKMKRIRGEKGRENARINL